MSEVRERSLEDFYEDTTRHGGSVNAGKVVNPGDEFIEEFEVIATKARMVQYDYRAPNGRHFCTVAHKVETCRARRDRWIAGGMIGAGAGHYFRWKD